MKRYKLKKDLPTFRAGDLFELRDDGCLYWVRGWRNPDEVKYCDKEVIAYHKNTLRFFPSILTDWFEEIKESTRWKPELHQKYYFLASDGSANTDTWDDSTFYDHGRLDIGNCFKTEEEAERVAEYLKALAVVREDATVEFIKGKSNYYVVYNTTYNCLDVSDNCYLIKNGIFGLPYFATEDDAQRSIEQHKKEWLTIFGIEEEE